MQKIAILFLFVFSNIFFSSIEATTLPLDSINQQKSKQEEYANIKPFNKMVKWSLIVGVGLIPIGYVVANIPVNPLTLFAFTEFLGGLIGFFGICLVALGLLFWFGRWLVRRHARLPENKRRWQWAVYLGGLITLILLGFLLVLEVPYWF